MGLHEKSEKAEKYAESVAYFNTLSNRINQLETDLSIKDESYRREKERADKYHAIVEQIDALIARTA